MASKVLYKDSVGRDLKKVDHPTARRLLSKLEQTLSSNPNAGTPLSGEFQGLLRYRVGDHRVIYTKIPEGVLILRVAHRKEVYR